MVGLVIPVFQNKFVLRCVHQFLNIHKSDIKICIVNDGQESMHSYLEAIHWPENVSVLHLPENRCFSGANNAGWRWLLEKYPSIPFLGSLNDDTKPLSPYMDSMVAALKLTANAGMVGAMQLVPEHGKDELNSYALWGFQHNPYTGSRASMVCISNKVETITKCAVLAGHCFLCRTEALQAVDFLDERYRNSCEDVDLSLKIRQAGWDLITPPNTELIHYGGQSRYALSARTDNQVSYGLLLSKWGPDLSIYNDLDVFKR